MSFSCGGMKQEYPFKKRVSLILNENNRCLMRNLYFFNKCLKPASAFSSYNIYTFDKLIKPI
ncbi:hypothetical protein PEPS_01330 [Persicobacter psychrovividus]|uniref:Uncharacterized protein n=1 Tax=Persicobacter psychrovividus TaxID=387638 RepID=A0ABM7VAB6_9BACT|nr:hypothetical protein PEPS_01330 [Persicobacter psychrovividus]